MKPTSFSFQNTIFAKDQPEYIPLPAWKNKIGDRGEVVSCWKLNPWERIKIIFTGRVWLLVCTMNNPLYPVIVSVNRDDVVVVPNKVVVFLKNTWIRFSNLCKK